jgi:hypothetical protein
MNTYPSLVNLSVHLIKIQDELKELDYILQHSHTIYYECLKEPAEFNKGEVFGRTSAIIIRVATRRQAIRAQVIGVQELIQTLQSEMIAERTSMAMTTVPTTNQPRSAAERFRNMFRRARQIWLARRGRFNVAEM